MATLMVSEVYDALIEAGASEAKARAAAQAVAAHEHRLAKIENDLAVVKWMLTTVIALNLAGFGFGLTLLLRVLSVLHG
jgi:hypothetical protein